LTVTGTTDKRADRTLNLDAREIARKRKIINYWSGEKREKSADGAPTTGGELTSIEWTRRAMCGTPSLLLLIGWKCYGHS
jgi:hypothetical protein